MRLVLAAIAGFLFTQTSLPANKTDDAVRSVLAFQTDAWNRGDLEAFVTTYEAECVFVGAETVKGRERVLARYRTKYPDRAHMGKLAFSSIEVTLVEPHVATVLGRFHLERAADAGGEASGVFSLVVHEQRGRWRIVLDHTS